MLTSSKSVLRVWMIVLLMLALSKAGSAQLVLYDNFKSNGCGYFSATMKLAKNQVILSNGGAAMTGNSRVIEVNEEYPRV